MSVPDAKNRALKNKEKIEKGLKKPKDHVGSLSSYEIDTHKLDSEALAWTPENPPNFQSLGKDCIKSKKTLLVPDNCGQVVKKYLDEKTGKGELVLNYQQEPKNLIVRRPKKRLSSFFVSCLNLGIQDQNFMPSL